MQNNALKENKKKKLTKLNEITLSSSDQENTTSESDLSDNDTNLLNQILSQFKQPECNKSPDFDCNLCELKYESSSSISSISSYSDLQFNVLSANAKLILEMIN